MRDNEAQGEAQNNDLTPQRLHTGFTLGIATDGRLHGILDLKNATSATLVSVNQFGSTIDISEDFSVLKLPMSVVDYGFFYVVTSNTSHAGKAFNIIVDVTY